ncbi:amino acid ABC transporter ATP-binding protein [Caviibacter abscessus]|uniref:amino acid ABC transporter ATP-binding protein n=1 Tax=Caviibacter abscessus TaxID=1766719 RepID=UPI0018D21D24|nr:amino acid ABC transporter ATP-binding protein [Caviibacter abscessus]
MLKINNLTVMYGNRTVLDNISITVKEKEVISIIGSSGSGKSTFLKCINLLEVPTSAEILFHNENIMTGDITKEQYRQKVGMVFQNFNLFNNLTVLENCILAPTKILKMSREEAVTMANMYLKKVGMEKYINAKPKHLSGGQKQRVAIARALCMKPEIILFDEPTSALDPEMVNEVLKTMNELAKDGITMIVVTHEMDFARNVSSRVIFLDKGKILQDGTADEVLNNPTNDRIKEFLNKEKNYEQ